MALTEKQKKHLRRLAHPMHPIVRVGQSGLTDGVQNELERALTDHELVKVGVRLSDRVSRNAALESLATHTHSDLVQKVGHVGVFYRRRTGLSKIVLPD